MLKHLFVTNDRLILGNYKERSASISAGDIDGDGRPDVVESNLDEVNYYYFNLVAR